MRDLLANIFDRLEDLADRWIGMFKTPRDPVAEFDASFGQFREELDTPEIRDLMGLQPARVCVGRASTHDTWNRCQYHVADWVLWHKGWGELLSTQICGTNPCAAEGVACDGGEGWLHFFDWCTHYEPRDAGDPNPCTREV